MKMKKFISLLVILCVAVTMLTACGKFSEKRTLSVSFPKTAHATYQGTETITNYSHDRSPINPQMPYYSSVQPQTLQNSSLSDSSLPHPVQKTFCAEYITGACPYWFF